MNTEVENLCRDCPIAEALGGEDQPRICQHAGRLERVEHRAPKNRLIYRAGVPARYMHVVRSGWLYRYSYFREGRKLIYDFLTRNDIILPQFVVANSLPSSVVCMTEVNTCRFDRSALSDMITAEPRLMMRFFSLTLAYLQRMELKMADIAHQPGKERLARAIVKMLQKSDAAVKNNEVRLPVPVTMRMFAELLGLSGAQISRVANELRAQRLVAFSGQSVHIQDLEGLMDLARITEHELAHFT